MKFSVIVPVYNHANYLEKGVHSALRSNRVDEVLLVDDGSGDASREVIRRLVTQEPGRVRDLNAELEFGAQPPNRGAAARLNQLVEASRADWIAVLNSDDVFIAGRFDLLRARLRRSPAEFACGQLLIVDAEGAVVGTKRGVEEPEYPFPIDLHADECAQEHDLVSLLANQNFIATTSNMVFTRDLHRRLGGFRNYRFVHDWDFALRAAASASCLYLPQFLTAYRDHASNSIKVDRSEIDLEVRAVFRDFEAEFGARSRQPGVKRALAGNRYLA